MALRIRLSRGGAKKRPFYRIVLADSRDNLILNASRKRRIAAGSGASIQDVNRLIKQFKDLSTMMKKLGKMGKKGLVRHGLPDLLPR